MAHPVYFKSLDLRKKVITSQLLSLSRLKCLYLGLHPLECRDTLTTKVYIVKLWFFSVVIYRCESWTKEGWAPKNWDFQILVLEKTAKSPLDCKEIKLVNPKGSQSCKFIVRTDAKAEAPYFGHLIWRTDSLEKTLMLGKIEGEGGSRGWDG